MEEHSSKQQVHMQKQPHAPRSPFLKVLFSLLTGLEILFRSIYFVVALIVILAGTYILGGSAFIHGKWGTDFLSALSTVVWIDKYFPSVPFWYPLVAGGASITHFYPMLSFYLAAFIRSISGLTIIESFTFLGFFSVVSMAVSIFFFVTFRFKNQTAAFLAAIFYLLSPIAWTWLVDWGFYAEAVSHSFAGPTILFWDIFFTRVLRRNWGVKTRVSFFFLLLFYSLAMGAHFIEGFALIKFFFFYLLGYVILSKGERKHVLLAGGGALCLTIILGFVATLVFTIPYINYTHATSLVGTGGQSYEQIKQALTNPLNVLGFEKYQWGEFHYAFRNFSFPGIVSVFAILGGLLYFFRDRRVLAFSLYALYGFTLTFAPDFIWFILKVPILSSLVLLGASDREMFILLRMIWPMLAALGVTGLFSLPFFRVKQRYARYGVSLLVMICSLSLAGYAVVTFGHTFTEGYRLFAKEFLQKNIDETLPSPLYGYGFMAGLDLRNIFARNDKQEYRLASTDPCTYGSVVKQLMKPGDIQRYNEMKPWCESPVSLYFIPLSVNAICAAHTAKHESVPVLCSPSQVTKSEVASYWDACKNGKVHSDFCAARIYSLAEQLQLSNWPRFAAPTSYDPRPAMDETLAQISATNPNARLDFSPLVSDLSMVSTYYNLNRSLSQLHAYISTASLLLRFQGWEQVVLMQGLSEFRNTNLINNIAEAFGINYLFLSSQTDASGFEQAGWKRFSGGYQFPEENSLAELSTKPAVLAIGQAAKQPYDQDLKIALSGAIPYKDAYLVWGKDAVDDYSLSELREFGVVLLHGYTYHNQGVANRLLREYVEGGGNLFIDTGWQYTVPDWQSSGATLDVVPLQSLSWKDLGKTSNYVAEDSTFFSSVDLTNFHSLMYGDGSWSVSTADKSNLKPWGKVVLSAEGFPLIVRGQLGKGRVVWSGMNIFSHAKPAETVYTDEVSFLHNVFGWLLGENHMRLFAVSYARENPDKVVFTLNEDLPEGGYLYWKEAYYSEFQTVLQTQSGTEGDSLAVYRGGPNFTLIRLPKLSSGSRIVHSYVAPWSEVIAPWISLGLFVLLLFFIVEGFAGKRSIIFRFGGLLRRTKFGRGTGSFLSSPKGLFTKNNEEEDY